MKNFVLSVAAKHLKSVEVKLEACSLALAIYM